MSDQEDTRDAWTSARGRAWRSALRSRIAKEEQRERTLIAALPVLCRFLTRPQLLTCLEPLPIGTDISPTPRRYNTSGYVGEGEATTRRHTSVRHRRRRAECTCRLRIAPGGSRRDCATPSDMRSFAPPHHAGPEHRDRSRRRWSPVCRAEVHVQRGGSTMPERISWTLNVQVVGGQRLKPTTCSRFRYLAEKINAQGRQL